ncbi:hypothetical protein ACT03H_27530 [Pseudomonas aeruginosa]|uniref:hypothetical protein n=1 Tax=Pseudomonas aeruginosa TaxID=287 RepID=UPI00402B0C9E
MNKALDLLREIRPSIPKEVLELWCKDRDAFLASHPAVEQAGGDERAALQELIRVRDWVKNRRGQPEKLKNTGQTYIMIEKCETLDMLEWAIERARAALAQPSPAQADEKPGDSILCYGCFAKGVGPDHFDEAGKCLAAQAEAERPEVVAYADPVAFATFKERGHEGGVAGREWMWAEPGAALVAMSRTDECERIVGALRAKADQLREALEWRKENQAGQRELLRSVTAERDAALARVVELERQEPVATVAKVPGEDWNSLDFHRDLQHMQPGTKLYAAPVAQAQHSGPEGWMLVECGIWTQEQVDEMQKTVTRFRNSEFVDDRALAMAVADAGQCKAPEISLAELLATAPGKEVPQAWIDVQAERRRQITAEGWTPEHDDLYCAAELPRAAAAYILNGANDEAPAIWPFVAKWWKPRDARSNYVRAGALILAEIERLDRAAPGKEGV